MSYKIVLGQLSKISFILFLFFFFNMKKGSKKKKRKMEINKDNFEELFPKIKKDIEECDFLSFDLEFTGLFPSAKDIPMPFDNSEQLYQ